MEYDKEEMLYNYQERLAICLDDYGAFKFKAKEIARRQLIDDLIDLGMKNFEAVFQAKKIIDEANESNNQAREVL